MKIPKGFTKGEPKKPGWYWVIQNILVDIKEIEGKTNISDLIEMGYVGRGSKDVYVVFITFDSEEIPHLDKALGGVYCYKKVREL